MVKDPLRLQPGGGPAEGNTLNTFEEVGLCLQTIVSRGNSPHDYNNDFHNCHGVILQRQQVDYLPLGPSLPSAAPIRRVSNLAGGRHQPIKTR